MKRKISLVNRPFLRSDEAVVTVNDENIDLDKDFIDGISLVKADLTVPVSFRKIQKTYSCVGIIDKKYNEYAKRIKDIDVGRYIMFMPNNVDGFRTSNCDFFITTRNEDRCYSYLNTKHMKIVNGEPIIVNTFSSATKTKIDGVVIADDSFLYDSVTIKKISRQYSKLELHENANEFIVTDIVSTLRYEDEKIRYKKLNEDTFIVDELVFKVDSNDNIISPIYSKKNHDIYIDHIPTISYETIKKNRRQELVDMEEKGKEIIKELIK